MGPEKTKQTKYIGATGASATDEGAHKQPNFVTHSFGQWKVQDGKTDSFDVWCLHVLEGMS